MPVSVALSSYTNVHTWFYLSNPANPRIAKFTVEQPDKVSIPKWNHGNRTTPKRKHPPKSPPSCHGGKSQSEGFEGEQRAVGTSTALTNLDFPYISFIIIVQSHVRPSPSPGRQAKKLPTTIKLDYRRFSPRFRPNPPPLPSTKSSLNSKKVKTHLLPNPSIFSVRL